MNICIDARSPGRTGVRTYMHRLLKSLLTIDKTNRYLLITDPNHGTWGFEDVEELVVPSMNPIYWVFWSNVVLPKLVHEKRITVYHTLKHITAFRVKAKKVATLHGVHMHYIFPKHFRRHETLYWKFATAIAAKTYDRIITVAHAEKRYLVERVGYPEDKFRITYLAGDARFRINHDKEELRKSKHKLNLPDQFILYVGMIHPRKNVEGVIRGYSEAKHRLKGNYKLVIVGDKRSTHFPQILNLVEHLRIENDVIFLGNVTDEDLPDVYNLADLFLFPSLQEGFGIVLMEAMACGLPVVTSNVADLCEVVGDAAVTVDPKNVHNISEGIVKVLKVSGLKQSLIQKGLERVKLFSWDRCARETLGVYEELVST